MSQKSSVPAGDRFGWLEYPNDDFPYYNGMPAAISGRQWLFVMFMVVLGFLALVAVPMPFFPRMPQQLVRPILFFAIPLVGLAIVTPRYWKALFRKVRGKDILWMIAFAALNMAVTMVVGFVIMRTLGAAANPATAGLGGMTASERVFFFFKTAPSLFGEEVMTILPFLAILYWFFSRMHVSRKQSIVWAWLLSAVLFGLAHLPTYDWNLVQCLVVIGTARLILTLPYIKTKNIWVSTGAHILNDWTFFGLTILGATIGAG